MNNTLLTEPTIHKVDEIKCNKQCELLFLLDCLTSYYTFLSLLPVY